MSFGLSLMVMVGIFAASLGLNLNSVALMSGHALSQQTSLRRLRRLIWSFWLGVVIATLLLLSTAILFVAKSPLIISTGGSIIVPYQVWRFLTISIIIQFLIMLFWKISNPNSVNPWVLDSVRNYLRNRCIKTGSAVEAISLGLMSVLINFWLLFLPLTALAMVLLPKFNLPTIILLALINGLPTLLIAMAVAQQIKISQIQLFLIKQAKFLQFISFFSLIILGTIIFCFKLSGEF